MHFDMGGIRVAGGGSGGEMERVDRLEINNLLFSHFSAQFAYCQRF